MQKNCVGPNAIDSGPATKLDLKELESRLAEGLKFSNMMNSMNQENFNLNKITLHSLIEVLINKGIIHLFELDERKQNVIRAAVEMEEKKPRVQLVETPDKYTYTDLPTINCQERFHLCKAACCKLWFALSVQDLDERIVRWEYARPYGIAQTTDGFCVHYDRHHHKCQIYKHRPLICRTYSCHEDARIWKDFENKIINPDLNAGGGSHKTNPESKTIPISTHTNTSTDTIPFFSQ